MHRRRVHRIYRLFEVSCSASGTHLSSYTLARSVYACPARVHSASGQTFTMDRQPQRQQQQSSWNDAHAQEWTLILWDIENVAVPEELRSAAGVQELTKVLKDTFATARSKELYSIKLACRWSHPRTPYSDLLGYLTTLGDVEALSYQWQGKADKVHNADRMLRRASDRFLRLMERRGTASSPPPRHLVVFITSDEDFSEQIVALQKRNFDVEVVYHNPKTRQAPVSIINAANRHYEWLEFLKARFPQIPTWTLKYDRRIHHAVTQFNRSNARVMPRQGGPRWVSAQQQGAAQQSGSGVNAASWRPPQPDAASGQTTGTNGRAVQPNRQAPQPSRPAAAQPHWSQQPYRPSSASAAQSRSPSPAIVPANQAADGACSLGAQRRNDQAIMGTHTAPPRRPTQPMPGQSGSANPSRAATRGQPSNASGVAHATPPPSEPEDTNVMPAGEDNPVTELDSFVPTEGFVEQSQGDGWSVSEAEADGWAVSEADLEGPNSSNSIGTGNGIAGLSREHSAAGAVSASELDFYPYDIDFCWGYTNPLDGGAELFRDEMANLEKQFKRLDGVAEADRPSSDYRWFNLAVGHDWCTLDLHNMLMSRHQGGEGPWEKVWRLPTSGSE